MPTDMFGHAASRWGSRQGENLATSALVYLLKTYSEAASYFLEALNRLMPQGSTLGTNMSFVEQLIADGGRIDAADIGAGGEHKLLIECKFSATLQNSQVQDYFNALAEPGMLLFVVPRSRRGATVDHIAQLHGYPYYESHERPRPVLPITHLASSIATPPTTT
jgi:hypothetical protein